MKKEDLIKYLRLQFSMANADVEDSVYLKMTDEEIELFLNTVMLRNFPNYTLDLLPQDKIFPVILLAKKELFYSLAIKEAPLYDIGADNNNYLKRSQRFKHYMQLVAQADKEFKDYIENGGAGGNTLTSFDVLLSSRYHTKRNYEGGAIPAPVLNATKITQTECELMWEVSVSKFAGYEIYIHSESILDLHNVSEKINPKAKKVVEIDDIHQKFCRLEKLVSDTEYFILLVVKEASGIKGYKELKIKTLA